MTGRRIPLYLAQFHFTTLPPLSLDQYHFAFSEQYIEEEFTKSDKNGTGYLSSIEIKQGLLRCLHKYFPELLTQSNINEENNETQDTSTTIEISNESNSKPVGPSLPSPPNSGWAWVVLFACFMCNVIIGNFVTLVHKFC